MFNSKKLEIMRKLSLLLVMFLMGLAVVQAQERGIRNQSAVGKANLPLQGADKVAEEHAAIPYQMNNPKSGSFIGTSYFPMQTNGTWHNRMIANANGTLSVVWPTSEPGSGTDRGTAYNLYRNGAWEGTSSARIEATRAGWGVIAPLGNGGEIVVSHNGLTTGGGLLINKRAVAGEGNWTQSVLLGPELTHNVTGAKSTCLLWPVLATVGDTVHIFALTENDTNYSYQGINTCLVYYRSTDNGATWGIQHQVVGGLDASYIAQFSADAYSIAAKPGLIVFVYGDFLNSDLFLLKSTDGGANWTKEILFDNPIKNLDFNVAVFDTTALPAETYAIVIDDNYKIHLAFNTVRVFRDATTPAGSFRWYPQGRIMYWNEDMPIFGNDRDAMHPDRNGAYPNLFWPELIGDEIDAIYMFNGLADLDNSSYRNYGHMFWPQMFVEDTTVYLFYVSAMPYPFRDAVMTAHWHGVFATKASIPSLSSGGTWDKTKISWLSYDPELFQVDWAEFNELVHNQGVEPVTALEGDQNQGIEGSLLMYSENAFPSVCLKDNTFHIVWFNDNFAGIEETFPSNIVYRLYYTSVPKNEIGTHKNTREIPTGIWNENSIPGNTLSTSSIYPNPVSDKLNMVITSTQADKAMVTMTNMLGQTVYSRSESLTAGANYLAINVAGYNAGIYIVNIKTNSGMISHKVVVR